MLNVLGIRVRPVGGSGVDCLRDVYPFWFREDDGAPADAEIEFTPEPDEEGGLVAFQRRLDAAVLERLSGFAIVHAGIVEVDGLLLLLPGPSRSGKSSFVSYLARRGARYLSDEYALIDARGCVHAYPRPPMLRDGSDRNYLDRDIRASVEQFDVPRRPDVVLFLEHRPEEPSASLWRIDCAAAVMGLLRNTPTTWRNHQGLARAFARTLRSAAGYRGVRGNADAAWDTVRDRLAADAVRPLGT